MFQHCIIPGVYELSKTSLPLAACKILIIPFDNFDLQITLHTKIALLLPYILSCQLVNSILNECKNFDINFQLTYFPTDLVPFSM